MSRPLRVGIVDFLNSRPLAWGFLRSEVGDRYRPVYASPARVADMLRAGEIEVGLVPAIEVLRIPGLEILPGPCVAATREVRSVLLLARCPLSEVRRIAADSSSRTSHALLRILLQDRHGVAAELVSRPPVPEGVPTGFDAALLIGDPALKVDREAFEVVDLAAAWRELTGLPFVFAVWAVRPGVAREGLASVFRASLESGLAAMDELVADAAAELGLAPADVRTYLTRNLRFWLGPEEIAGLREFYRRAGARGLGELAPPPAAAWRRLAEDVEPVESLPPTDPEAGTSLVGSGTLP